MKRLIILSGTPKTEGLTVSYVEAVRAGAEEGGLAVELAPLCRSGVGICRVCGDGWGPCGSEGRCAFGDDGFAALTERLAAADAAAVVSPVYWGELSETLKGYFDRLRRCEARKGEGGALYGKPVLCVAVAGGSGNGTLSCLEQCERVLRPLGANITDRISATRFNSPYTAQAARAAGRAMAGRLA